MSHDSSYKPNSGFERWMDERLPIIRMGADFLTFPTPRNLNYFWTFGGILTFCLMVQIVTGIVLAMHYIPDAGLAFDSVQHILRDVPFGWLIQPIHMVGASMFFIAVYIHMFRGLFYGSYKGPREVLWILGMLIYALMMATAFMGYSLVWGQMSFWGVTVITSLVGTLDEIIRGSGTWLLQMVLGGYSVNPSTLNRLYSLHYLLPFAIAGLVVLHIWALHVNGNNNPTGLMVKKDSDVVPFHPYMTIKDGFALSIFILLFAWFVLPAGLPRRPDQQRAGQCLEDAGRDRAGMVFPAVLRNTALDPLQIARRHRLCRFDRLVVLRALARYLARALGQIPASLQVVLLAVRDLVHRPHLSWRQAARGLVRDLVADLFGLLLPLFHNPAAAAWPGRDAAADAQLDHRIGAGCGRRRAGRRRGLGRKALEPNGQDRPKES